MKPTWVATIGDRVGMIVSDYLFHVLDGFGNLKFDDFDTVNGAGSEISIRRPNFHFPKRS